MIADRDTGGQNAQPEKPPEEVVQAAHELAEALTAVGNFVAAAMHLFDDGQASGDELRKALAGASSQQERAGFAARRLFQLLLPGWAEPRE